jgi:serine/threonine protein kinase/tetratricopeptide (TPR) repeat protein
MPLAPSLRPDAPADEPGTVRNWTAGPPAEADPAAILRDLNDRDPARADRLRDALGRFPVVGSHLAGFRLVALLGKGAFGRVYLAQQGDLAERYVALKVSADLAGESRTLARLQHTNIVPVYSVHHADPFHAVCMPYLGPITLAGLLGRCRELHALPTTGRELVNTLSGLTDETEVASGLPVSRPSTAPGAVPAGPAGEHGRLPDRPPAVLRLLSGLSYVDAVCWIGSRLADALAHAHDRGVVHNDLKPANVLLADDGQPMLLDFGVSDDLRLRAEAPNAPVGGTLPYMSPEQLAATRGGDWTPDPRSDVYALGVILYELLCGAHPFRVPAGGMAREVDRMVADRRAGPPPLRPRNPAVSPGLEAVVRKALAADPAGRYQSAADLREDLDRHRADQPLRFARVPSARERVRKWCRRHPRLSSNATVAAVAAVVVVALGVGLDRRARRIERYEAEDALRAVEPDVQAAHYLLVTRAPAADMVAAGVLRARAALDRYGAVTDPDWEQRPRYAALPPDDRRRLRSELAEACLLLARGALLGHRPGADGEDRLREAVRLNERAEELAGDDAPRAVWLQRAELFAKLGDAGAAARAAERAAAVPVVSARDHYLLAREAVAAGRPREAAPLLEKALDLDPALFCAHMAQGLCHEDAGRFAQARASYTAAVAVRPGFAWAYYNRGLVALRGRDYSRAKADLDKVTALEPGFADGYVNRAVAHQGLRRYADGIADLDRAAGLGASAARVCFLRAWLREAAGDAAGATADREEGMRREPADEHGWLARGSARMRTDPAGAAADFEAALRLNPRSLPALQNRAHVLGRLGRNAESAAVLDRAVELYPDHAPARAGRGVMNARLGRWAAAEEDAREALRRGDDPAVVYQAAGIYALLAGHDPRHKVEAVRLLAAALRVGYGFEHIEADRELDPIRSDAEFRKVVEGARSLRPAGG